MQIPFTPHHQSEPSSRNPKPVSHLRASQRKVASTPTPNSYIIDHKSFTLHPTPHTLRHHTPHPTPHTPHLTPHTPHRNPLTPTTPSGSGDRVPYELSLSHTHTHALSLSLSHTLSVSRTHAISPSLTHTHNHTHSLSFSLMPSLSLTQTHSHTH